MAKIKSAEDVLRSARVVMKYGGNFATEPRRPSKTNPVVDQSGSVSARPSFMTLQDCKDRLAVLRAILRGWLGTPGEKAVMQEEEADLERVIEKTERK